ncbi:hypothetical protein ACIBCO_40325 [Streptomyces violascens]|uniref:hypothetical protein n=1 Tax=Streptomyces violascens TaxID=67381 RepID=UPI0037B7E27F
MSKRTTRAAWTAALFTTAVAVGVVTAETCFAGNGQSAKACASQKNTAAVGRTNLAQTGGTVTEGDGLNADVRWWGSGNDFWNCKANHLTAGDITGDGKASFAVHYDYGQSADDHSRARIWTFTNTGTAMNPLRSGWDSLIG